MDTIISAGISAGVALVVGLGGSYFMYLSKIHKILSGTENLEKGHADLLGEHKDRSTENRALSDEHKQLLSNTENIIDTTKYTREVVTGIREAANAERVVQQTRYDNLSEKQKNITENVADSIKAFEAMKAELLRVNSENTKLLQDMHQTSTENDKLHENVRELKFEVKQLFQENKNIVEKYNALVAKINQNQQQKNQQQPRYYDSGWDMEL